MNDHISLATSTINHKTIRQEKRSNKSLVYILAIIVILFAAILVFAHVVMRPTSPRARLGPVVVRNLASPPFFNISLNAEMIIKNKNFGPFDFDNGTARFLCDGVMVGETKLGRGHVKARGTMRVNIAVEVRLSSEVGRNLSNDISSDRILKLSSYAVLRGRVHLIKIVKKRTALMNCTMSLRVRNSSIENLVCA